jgi:hypothetical protein
MWGGGGYVAAVLILEFTQKSSMLISHQIVLICDSSDFKKHKSPIAANLLRFSDSTDPQARSVLDQQGECEDRMSSTRYAAWQPAAWQTHATAT